MYRRSSRILIPALATVLVTVLMTGLTGPAAAQSPAAAATVRLTGSVHGTGGQPLDDVQVALYRDGVDDGTRVATRRTSDTGRFMMPAVPKSSTTSYHLIADDLSGHHVLTYSDSFMPTSSHAAPDVTMPTAGIITGRVFTKDGDAVEPGTTVQVSSDGPTTSGDVRVAANGSFRIGGLAPGSYEVFFNDLTHEFSSTCYDNVRFTDDGCDGETVTVVAGKATTISSQVLDHRAGSLSGTVADTEGHPLGDVTVSVYAADDVEHFIGETRTDAAGDWTRTGIEFAGDVKLVARDDSGTHRVTWYRDAATFATATPLTLRDSGEIDDIGFVMPAR